jgi:hypothetical protein
MMNCFANIRARWSELAGLLEEINSHWVYEDLVTTLEMAVKYGKELQGEPTVLSGWATLLCLYNVR